VSGVLDFNDAGPQDRQPSSRHPDGQETAKKPNGYDATASAQCPTTPQELAELISPGRSENRSGHWYAICPCHDDHTPSLCIDHGDKQPFVFKCRAECRQEDIIYAIKKIGISFGSDKFGSDKPSAKVNNKFRAVATFYYRDESGTVLSRVVRMEKTTANGKEKTFPQQSLDENGNWRTGKGAMKGVRRVLYRLPQLLAADPNALVFVPEGEKHCDKVAEEVGLIATCNPGGAGKWRAEFNEFFRGRHAVVLADNDQPGRDHALSVARQLYGIAASVRILELPGLLRNGDDVIDWIEANPDENSPQKLTELALAAPIFELESATKPNGAATHTSTSSNSLLPTEIDALLSHKANGDILPIMSNVANVARQHSDWRDMV
jgi:putative DNA primase/helicase